jgi:hypothetical protein
MHDSERRALPTVQDFCHQAGGADAVEKGH